VDAAWQARPSVLATKVALLDILGQVEQAASTLSSAMQHWQSGKCRLTDTLTL
jgi:tripartite-type tricarboxylate transporter receptor subunit TctC